MATMQGITGKLSGKMGSAVFRVREGQQVVTQYNPIVKNPNTEGQQNQRAKFKLMSQLAAIMAPGFGTMSVTSRKAKGKPSQRNAFTQLNFNLIEVANIGQEVVAKIPMNELKLTSSFRNLPSPVISGGGGDLSAQISGIATDVTAVRFVLVGYVGETTKQAVIVSIMDAPVSTSGVTTPTASADFDAVGAGDYTVLAYGLIPSESAKATINLDNIHTPADEDFISAVQLNAMVEEGSMAETMTVGVNYTLAD